MIPAVPGHVDAVTPQWLSAALTRRFPGVEVEAAQFLRRIEGTATKLHYQLSYRRTAGAPATLWLKCGFDTKGAAQGEAFANEVHFFRDIAALLPINTPDCYFGEIDPKTRDGVVLLEDLLKRGARFGQASESLGVDQVADILSLQAAYHAVFWGNSRLDAFPWLKAAGALSDSNMVDQYMGLWARAQSLPRFDHVPAEQRDKRRVRDALARLIFNLKHEPICLVHGDAHAANLFFDADGRPGYLDWQHVMRGNWAFDVCSLLITSLTIADRRANEVKLLEHYLRELRARGADAPGFDDAWLQYRRYAMWPFMWVMCPPEVHPEAICTANSARACAAIGDLETIQQLEVSKETA